MVAFCYLAIILVMSSFCRDPFFNQGDNKKAETKEYILKGTIIVDFPMAHIEYDNELSIVEVNDTIGCFTVEKIESGIVVLLKDNKHKVLELGQRTGEEA